MAEHADHGEQPSAVYEQLLHVPMKAAWDRLLDFGGWADWAPNLFQSMKIINGKKGVGAIRRFKTGNDLLYEELLAEADEAAGHFRYDFVSIVPKQEGLDGVISRVTLVPVDKEKTLITWKSWTKFGNIPEQAKQRIGMMQRVGFMKETQGLEAGIIVTKILNEGMAFFNKKVTSLTRSLLTKQGDMWQYDEYPDNFGFLPKMVKGLPPSEVLPPHKIGGMLTRFLEVIYLQAAQLIDDQNNPLRPANPNMPYLQETMGMMQIGHTKAQGLDVVTGHVVKHWSDDAEFCRQLIQGVNPLHIKMVTDIHEVPDTLAGLTTPKSSGENLTVKELIAAKRLFILDYSELATYTINPPLYFSAPVLLVFREILDKNTSRLNILGIQLHPSHKEVYTPDMPQKNRYKLAKMFTASADNQYHEFRYHLGISHMGVEPIVIATHNRIPQGHPLKSLLTPHFEGTIGIAYFARQTLIDVQDPFTDKTFALGTHQGIKLASDGWRKYNFFKSSFPEQLKARGFDEAKTDGVQDYFYRDDGFKLWNYLGDYATDFVNKFYANDASVLDDSDLQRWADELAAKEGGNLPGFPNIIKTREELIHVLQIIIWNCSAQHSAINYSQWPYLGYIPNRPNAMYQPMPELPEDGSDITDEYVNKSLAPTLAMLFQITFPWLLTAPSESTLLNLSALKDIYPAGNAKFHENMTKLTLDIKSRNQALEAAGKAPYIYLLPENVAASVTI